MRAIVLLTAAAVTLAACGTTADDADPTAPPPAATSEPETTETDTTESATAGPETTESDTTESTEPVAPIRGVDGDTVKVGFVVITNQAAASEQAGAEGVTTIEQDAAVQIIVDDLNRRGGLAGLTVEPVFFEVDATAGVDQQTIVQSYCATFTQDNEVYAVLGASEPSAEQRACLDEAGVPVIVAGGPITFLDDAAYDSAPLLVNISGLSLDSVATSLVEGLDAAGWFEDGSTVGVVRLQDDAFDAATADSLQPALEAAGVTVASEVAIAAIQSQDDIGRVSTEAQAAVLVMKDAGVDRLIFFESGGALPFFFMNAAREQQFAPALAFSTTSGGQTLVDNIQTGGTGIGWSPLVDLPADGQPALPPRAQECFDLLDPTGAAFVTATAQSQALSFCDVVWLLEAASTSGLSDGAGVVASIESLGDTFESASLATVRFGPDKRDGVAQYSIVDYDAGCGCNVYRSDPPAPVS
jgi:hypothetical protein